MLKPAERLLEDADGSFLFNIDTYQAYVITFSFHMLL
jgi:hypothetical protein